MDTHHPHDRMISQVQIQTDLAWERNKLSLTRYGTTYFSCSRFTKTDEALRDKVKVYTGLHMYYTQWATGYTPSSNFGSYKVLW